MDTPIQIEFEELEERLEPNGVCRELDITEERIEEMLKAGANVILTTKGTDDKYFSRDCKQDYRLNEGIHTVPSRRGRRSSYQSHHVGSTSSGTASTTPTNSSVNSSNIFIPLRNLTLGPDVPPPAHLRPPLPTTKTVLFRYLEKSLDTVYRVPVGFDLNHPEAVDIIIDVISRYSRRLHIDLENFAGFPFTLDKVTSNLWWVSLKSENSEHGLEAQLNASCDTVANLIGEAEVLNQEKATLVESLERRELSEKMDSQSPSNASLKDEIKKLKDEIKKLKEGVEENSKALSELQETVASQRDIIASNSKALSSLLLNAGLQYKTRRRQILERARQKLVRTLHKRKKNCSWEMYVENLSEEEKLKCGASAEMLKEMGSGMYTLNKDVHKDGPLYEMAHAVNNVSQPGRKKIWQELFCYVYSKHPEAAEFGLE